MKKYFRLIISNLRATISLRNCLGIIGISILISLPKLMGSLCISSLDEYIKYIYYGPKNLTGNISETLNWIIYQSYLIYVIGNYVYKEFKIRNMYTISRIGSKLTWYICIQINALITCIIYYSINIAVNIMCIVIFNKATEMGNLLNIANIYFILILTSYLIVSIYFCALFFIKNHAFSFISTIIILFLSILLGDSLNIDPYIPINRGILVNHYILGLNYIKSYIYIILVITINVFISKQILFKEDLLESMK